MDSSDPFKWPDDFEKVIPDLHRGVMSVCLRQGFQLTDAEDVLQHVLYKMTLMASEAASGRHQSGGFARAVNVFRYGIRIAVNYIKETWKTEGRRRFLPAPDPTSLQTKEEPDEEFTVILNLIDDPLQREAVRLKVVEDCSYQEIGKRLNVSKSQARNLVQRGGKQAIRRLRE